MRAATSVRASARTGARAPRRASARMMGMAGREVGTREGGRPQHWLPGEWPDPELVDYCGANFPDDGIATVEQGYTLMMDYDYTVLDVRCDPELNVTPVIRTGVNVPIIFGKKKFENGQITYDQVRRGWKRGGARRVRALRCAARVCADARWRRQERARAARGPWR